MNLSAEWATFASIIVGGLFTAVGWSMWASWWLSKQFSQTRNLIWSRGEEVKKGIEEKLEYHEKHDDQRFSEIRNDLWAIRIRNAARDKEILETEK